jgi:leader peptidase (prepilin peptidase)/N-methyltransferase
VITEAATALVLAAIALRLGTTLDTVPYVVVVTALAAVTITDLRDHRVPNRVVYPAMMASALIISLAAVVGHEPERLWWAAWGSALFSGTLLAIHLVRPDGMGRGDVKLAVVLGAALGWLRPPWLDGAVLVTWALGGASALGLVLAALTAPGGLRGDRTGRPPVVVPFAPALSVATIAVVLLAGRPPGA